MKAPKKPIHRKRTPFYWWRRFRTHKSLPYKATLLDKIRNGDFKYPEYFQQAEWELEWMRQEQKEFIDSYTGDVTEIESDILQPFFTSVQIVKGIIQKIIVERSVRI